MLLCCSSLALIPHFSRGNSDGTQADRVILIIIKAMDSKHQHSSQGTIPMQEIIVIISGNWQRPTRDPHIGVQNMLDE